MVDIESKSLNFLRSNILSLDKISEKEVEALISDITYINDWTILKKLKTYINLAESILTETDVNETWNRISLLAHKYQITSSRKGQGFYAVVSDFKDFLARVYEIYLLDQILFILNNKDIIKLPELLEPQKTKSNYEEYNYGLSLIQESLDGESFRENIDKTLYQIKDYYLKELNNLLKKDEYLETFTKLKDFCESIATNPQNKSWYIASLCVYLVNIKIPNRQMARTRTMPQKKNNNQLTFFND